jgi:hypothetical protein
MVPTDFCAFILTHGRPDRVFTYENLKQSGYTGKVFIVIDDEDNTANEYRKRFGDIVLTFSKGDVAKTFDEADNFNDRRAIVYARNACFALARQVGCSHFIELDDDYNSGFYLRFNAALEYGNTPRIKDLDGVLCALLDFYKSTPIHSIAMSQGGDHIGGNSAGQQAPRLKRKAMNSFICSTERPFQFQGRVNEDVNTYTEGTRRGLLFFTTMQAMLDQLDTQSNSGGMTDLYLDSGTYVKSFYSVMYAPSCVRVGELGDPRQPRYRLHHSINWRHTAPLILRESHRKASRADAQAPEARRA